MKLIYLTYQDNKTYYPEMIWSIGKTNSIVPIDTLPGMFLNDIMYAYTDVGLALILNSIHYHIPTPRIFECEGDVVVSDWDRVGVYELTPIRELDVPEWYQDTDIKKKVEIQFSILCSESVINIWENKYPDDSRPRKAIEFAKMYLKTPKGNFINVENYSAYDARMATYLAEEEGNINEAYASLSSQNASLSVDTYYGSALAAKYALNAGADIDLIELVKKSVDIITLGKPLN